MKGFIRELAAILGIFIGVVAAYVLADKVFKYFTIYFESVDFELKIISYVVVFFATILLVNVLASLLTKTLKIVALNGINRILGAIFGAIKWATIMTLVVFSLNRIQKNRTIF
ncbi:MAG: CvpA family protein, partial [Croceimicrobium sp.]